MAHTYTSSNRLTKMADGSEERTWGQIMNTQVIDLTDQAMDRYVTIDVSAGDVTLTANNGTTDQARSRILKLRGDISVNRTITLPDVHKWYLVEVSTSGSGLTIIKNTSDTTGVSVSANSPNLIIRCDGTSTKSMISDVNSALFLQVSNNLSDLNSAATARTNLGLGVLAQASVSTANVLLGTTSASPVAFSQITPSQGITVSNQTIKADIATTASAGIIEVATTAEYVAGASDTVAVTPAAVAGNISATSTGSIAYPGGLIEKWGRLVGFTGNADSQTVTFTSAFPTALYNIALTISYPAPQGSGGALVAAVDSDTIAVTGFDVFIDNVAAAGSCAVYWRAIGK